MSCRDLRPIQAGRVGILEDVVSIFAVAVAARAPCKSSGNEVECYMVAGQGVAEEFNFLVVVSLKRLGT